MTKTNKIKYSNAITALAYFTAAYRDARSVYCASASQRASDIRKAACTAYRNSAYLVARFAREAAREAAYTANRALCVTRVAYRASGSIDAHSDYCNARIADFDARDNYRIACNACNDACIKATKKS